VASEIKDRLGGRRKKTLERTAEEKEIGVGGGGIVSRGVEGKEYGWTRKEKVGRWSHV